MLARLALAALAIVLVVALLTYFGGRIRSGSEQRAREAHRARVEAEAELVAARAQHDATTEAQREAAPVAETVLVESEPAPESSAPEAQRLHGVLVHSSEGRPAAGASLAFWCGEHDSEAVTDDAGRFEVELLAPTGVVHVYHRGDAPDPVQRQHLDIRPEIFPVPEPGPGGEREPVELTLLDPPAWLAVEVVTTAGVPTVAELHWLVARPEPPRVWMRSPTDAGGRARLAFPSVEPGAYVVVLAQRAELVSDPARIDSPPPGTPVRLVLDAGGSLLARALDTDGKPVVDEPIRMWAKESQDNLLGTSLSTDGEGVALFSALTPGPHLVSWWDESSSTWVRGEAVVERGLRAEVELRAPSLPIAVSGRVVDAGGRGVEEVAIIVSVGSTSTTTVTEADGAFSVGLAEAGNVLLRVEADVLSDRYEPVELEVAFGTRDVLIRQSAVRPEVVLVLEVLESRTRTRIPDALVLGYVEPWRSDWSYHRAKEGLVTFECKLHDDVWLAVDAVGYRRRVLRATELVRDVPPGSLCRVLLESGLERVLRVEDEDGTPIAGARVLDGERLVATTDQEGRAAIELASWPVELRVQAAGHVEDVWPCKDWIAELEDGVVWLERVPPEESPPGER